MKKVLLILSIMLAFSCSKEEVQNQESPEALNVANKVIIIPSECSGYGIFDNEEYDCGWKIGYDDWVAHYNYVINSGNHPECYKIRVVIYDYNGEDRVTLVWQTIDNSMAIIQEAQNNNWTYYNNLNNINNPTDRELGQQAGYSAGRGQQPFAANDTGSCN